MSAFPLSPLSLDCLTRDTYGNFDPIIIAQLAPLAHNKCYQPKIYRAPSVANEIVHSLGYTSYGLKITPGAIIYGLFTLLAPSYNVQITDQSLKHKWFDEAVPNWFLANSKRTALTSTFALTLESTAVNFLDAPYPVVGNGLLLCEFWAGESNADIRIELAFAVLEPIGEACL